MPVMLVLAVLQSTLLNVFPKVVQTVSIEFENMFICGCELAFTLLPGGNSSRRLGTTLGSSHVLMPNWESVWRF